MAAYYNEIDPYAAQWLRNLIAGGHIAPGDVDQRDIRDVSPSDLAGYTQCHFFAGIGVWSASLRLAGWPDERPVWTFSEPCQPFSASGRGLGTADERYLRPYTHHLVRVGRPAICFGEQVASPDGLAWLDTLQADMEGEGYALWPVDLCAAGVGAPHIRQRLGFCAPQVANDLLGGQRIPTGQFGSARGSSATSSDAGAPGRLSGLELPYHGRRGGREDGPSGDVGDGSSSGRSKDQHGLGGPGASGLEPTRWSGEAYDPWGDADWLLCRDGRWRPVEPGTFPLAHGSTSRVGRLRAYGNAIVRRWAATIIANYLEAEADGFTADLGDGNLAAELDALVG